MNAAEIARRNATVMRHWGLIPWHARRFHGKHYGLEWDDIVQEGALGLLRAVELYQPQRSKLGYYAGSWIINYTARAVGDTHGAFRVPAPSRLFVRRYERALGRIRRSPGAEPTFEQVASAAGIPSIHWDCLRHALQVYALPAAAASQEFLESLPVAEEPDTNEEQREALWTAVDRLGDPDASVLRLRYRYGLLQREVAQCLGINRDRVHHFERRALTALREAFSA